MKYGSDKEVQAVCMLQKEQRLLEKRDAGLKLEKEYALKLLELGSREVKLSQRRLKANVDRIKSYLSAEEIKDFRRQEMLGKFKPEINTIKVSGAFTIAAAAKRLRLQAEQRMAANGLDADGKPIQSNGKKRRQREVIERLTRSAPPRRSPGSTTSASAEHPFSNNNTQTNKLLKRAKTCSTFRDFDSVFEDVETLPESPKTPRAPMSIPLTSREPTSPRKQRPMTSNAEERGMYTARSKSSLGYSSHDAMERESRDKDRSELNSAPANRHLSRRPSISGSSIDGDLVKGRAEERRQVLLDVEEMQCQKLMDKKKEFLGRIQRWVEMNPGYKETNEMDKLMEVLNKDDKKMTSLTFAKEDKAPERRKARRQESFSAKVVFKKRQEPLVVEWNSLNKCRYLRIADEEVDLSGVVTLATEQMKALQSLRVTDHDDDD